MKAFFNTKSIVRRVLIVSLLAGGLVFAGAFAVNIFVPTPTEASDCCGSSESEPATDVNSNELENCCSSSKTIPTTSSSCSCTGTDCGSCSSGKCSTTKPGCPDGASCKGTDGCSCDGTICGKSSKCSGSCG